VSNCNFWIATCNSGCNTCAVTVSLSPYTNLSQSAQVAKSPVLCAARVGAGRHFAYAVAAFAPHIGQWLIIMLGCFFFAPRRV
jgi:hypothetical protein